MRETMRLDRLLVYLRFARTRSKATAMIEAGHMRLNGTHVARSSAEAGPGDVLVFPWGSGVRIVEILELPDRRGSPDIARSQYRELDRAGEISIAAEKNCD